MLLAALPPAVVKSPPAYRSLPDTASADTPSPFIPEPSADQLLPFHLAMLVGRAAARRREIAPRIQVAARHRQRIHIAPFIPEPSADQLLPFHLAMLLAALPPAVVNNRGLDSLCLMVTEIMAG